MSRYKYEGFPDFGFSTVIKFGGSLMRNPAACRSTIVAIETIAASGHNVLIVPGGGIPDKAIEAINVDNPLSPFTAHHACALAQDQTGYLLSDPEFSSNLVPCASLGDCKTALQKGSVPVLLPSRILFAIDPVAWSWDITSDAVAAWFAWLVGARSLAVLTDVDGIYADGDINNPEKRIVRVSARDLVGLGHTSIDVCAVAFMAGKGITGAVLNGHHPDRLIDWMEGRATIATDIVEHGSMILAADNDALVG
ncbi:MAG: aspartate kinase [Hyphomicrobiales bacterium]|nr:MAG: aspartate kinase [Hyphomicrobiales bacterium]